MKGAVKCAVQGAVQGAVLWFPRWEPAVPIFRNWKFFAMVTLVPRLGSSGSQTFRYRSIKQNKRFCYRLSKQNKTTLGTMIFIFLESTDPSTGNVCFFRFGTMSFKLSQTAIPYNDSCLASKT